MHSLRGSDSLSMRPSTAIPCRNDGRGCPRTFACKSDEVDHSPNCLYQQDTCHQCGRYYDRIDNIKHFNSICSKRIVNCLHCRRPFAFIELEDHENSCQKKPTKCTYCPLKLIVEELEGHLLICDKRPVSCFLKKGGCSFTAEKPDMDLHEGDHQHHLVTLSEKINSQEKDIRDLRAILKNPGNQEPGNQEHGNQEPGNQEPGNRTEEIKFLKNEIEGINQEAKFNKSILERDIEWLKIEVQRLRDHLNLKSEE